MFIARCCCDLFVILKNKFSLESLVHERRRTYTSKPPVVSSLSHCIQTALHVISLPAGHCVINDVLWRVCCCLWSLSTVPLSQYFSLHIRKVCLPSKPIISLKMRHPKGGHGDEFFRDSKTGRKKSWVLINFTGSTISTGQQTHQWPQRTSVSLTYGGFNECTLLSGQ